MSKALGGGWEESRSSGKATTCTCSWWALLLALGPQSRSMLPSVCLSIYLVWASTHQQRRVSVTVGSQTVLGEDLCP